MKNLGQLFITGISGLELTQEEKEFISQADIGGVIYFKHNFENPAQLLELSNEIQTLRDEYPLFVSVDHEGGRVQRFKSHFTQFPSMKEVASKNSPKLTFEVHSEMATELSACGINLSYSPCCDIWSNPKNNVIGDRAFGSDIETVEKNVSAAIRGLHTNRVIACAKHFPGHGDTLKDSHVDLPYIKKSLAELEEFEIKPFIRASKSRVEIMMMAHLMVDAVDNQNISTLSSKMYSLLRDKCKFKGLIITDDLEMGAIKKEYSTQEIAIKALEAGADILLYRSMEEASNAYQAVKEAIVKKIIPKDLIEDKISRVLKCKESFLSDYQPGKLEEISKRINPEKSRVILESINPTRKVSIPFSEES